MFTARRRSERKKANLPINIALYNSTDDSIVTGPHVVMLSDITYYGAGLVLKKIHFPPHHLFYSANEVDEYILCIGKEIQNGDPLVIPVKPIWFRLGEEEFKDYFRMGLEFLTAPEDKEVIDLEKLALDCFEPDETLFDKLIRLFN